MTVILGRVCAVSLFLSLLFSKTVLAQSAETIGDFTISPGHESLAEWSLASEPPHPEGNAPTAERVDLGKKLFFDPRLSFDGNMSCASCHNPMLGWSDGQATARGLKSAVLDRATPTIINTAYNTIQMWDGRAKTLEEQATGPLDAELEMAMDTETLFSWLQSNASYRDAFEAAYPGEGITRDTYSKAVASFERTIISNSSPFDHWVEGDASAMTEQQVRGFKLFIDEEKGNCAVCHSGGNFTDNGFHNLGLLSFDDEEPDMGRHHIVPIGLMKGAFKTPTLRDVFLTPPYFHDGSAETLLEVVDHYVTGGQVDTNVSPNMKALELTEQERLDIVAFMEALTSPQQNVSLPLLPVDAVSKISEYSGSTEVVQE